MAATPGDTFLLTGGPVLTPHLWVILWGPAGPAGAYLAVMLTSLRPYSDVLASSTQATTRSSDTRPRYRIGKCFG